MSRASLGRIVALLVGSSILGAGCGGTPRVSLVEGARSYRHEDYGKVFERWSRHGGVVSFPEFEDHLGVDATYLGWDFRWAYAARYAHDARLEPGARAQSLANSLETARREHEFFVALYTDSTRWGDLGRPTSAWRVTLVDDQGRAVEPIRVERVRRVSAAERNYFPYVTPWRLAFRVHFPRRATAGGVEYDVLGAGTRYFVLRFGGAYGATDLRWDVSTADPPG